ncbi:hypothetical protein GCM10018790_12970 [Kitasatospora xanthocidica]|nr:hypothetical protein GCM10018790_12970 [Kitasatospora xanthocidica]
MTATRSPRRGSTSAYRGRDSAARRQHAGCEAISAAVWEVMRRLLRKRGWRHSPGARPGDGVGYLTDPAVSPDTTRRSMRANSTTTGTIATTDPAKR